MNTGTTDLSHPAPTRPCCPHGVFVVSLLTLGLLLPFINKAFHIDDTLFLRLAEQIRSDPLAPYEMEYNWFHEPESFWQVTQNPPLNGYVLAAAENVVGSAEWTLRVAAYFPIAIVAAVLSYLLAARFSQHPLPVAVLTLIAPAFSISATNVSADVLLLVFWLLAIWLTVRAADTGKAWLLLLAGLAAAAAAMTKYFGIALVPLLAVYWYLRELRIADCGLRIGR
ncbi:MAG: glycosyltransferase family 39 protein, partial [Planctomycetaceae bacterium]